MYYGIVKPCDVPEEAKDAAYKALKIAQERLDIPENTEIVFFAEMNTAEKHTKSPEPFNDSLEYRLRAKARDGNLYVNFSQYDHDVMSSVLAGCWIMEVNKVGSIYCSPNALKYDHFLKELTEDAIAFADNVLKEIDK